MKRHYRPRAIANLTRLVLVSVGFIVTWDRHASAAPILPGISEAVLKELTPEGYKHAKNIPWKGDSDASSFRIAAFSDANEEEPLKPVMLMLLSRENGKWRIRDTVWPHHNTGASGNDFTAPNYFTEMGRVLVGSGNLILVRTTAFGGGSGSLQYFDLYTVVNDKLSLIKSFAHGRMQRYYFTVYENSVYDADLVCQRGERHRKSFVYTCYLQVARYGFDGRSLVQTGAERLGEKQGNRFLGDSYRFMSVEKALRKGKIFAEKEGAAEHERGAGA